MEKKQTKENSVPPSGSIRTKKVGSQNLVRAGILFVTVLGIFTVVLINPLGTNNAVPGNTGPPEAEVCEHGEVVAGPYSVEREAGAPESFTWNFDLIPGNYTICVHNHNVSSDRVYINGIEVVSPQDLNINVEDFRFPVELYEHNTLYVTISSQPGSSLNIFVLRLDNEDEEDQNEEPEDKDEDELDDEHNCDPDLINSSDEPLEPPVIIDRYPGEEYSKRYNWNLSTWIIDSDTEPGETNQTLSSYLTWDRGNVTVNIDAPAGLLFSSSDWALATIHSMQYYVTFNVTNPQAFSKFWYWRLSWTFEGTKLGEILWDEPNSIAITKTRFLVPESDGTKKLITASLEFQSHYIEGLVDIQMTENWDPIYTPWTGVYTNTTTYDYLKQLEWNVSIPFIDTSQNCAYSGMLNQAHSYNRYGVNGDIFLNIRDPALQERSETWFWVNGQNDTDIQLRFDLLNLATSGNGIFNLSVEFHDSTGYIGDWNIIQMGNLTQTSCGITYSGTLRVSVSYSFWTDFFEGGNGLLQVGETILDVLPSR